MWKVFVDRKIAVVIMLVFFSGIIYSQSSGYIDSNYTGAGIQEINGSDSGPFELSWLKESLITVTGAALLIPGLLIKTGEEDYTAGVLDKNKINPFDRWAARPYSKPLDITGSILVGASILTPAVLLATDKNQWFNIGVMYFESSLLAFSTADLLKEVIQRKRPYMYFSGYPEEEVKAGDYCRSFPSRHTAMAFNGAVFTSYVFSTYFPESKYKVPVIAGSFTLAGATGLARILSGNHFISDVLAGAAIGSASGFLVPFFHRVNSGLENSGNGNMDISLLPAGLALNFRY